MERIYSMREYIVDQGSEPLPSLLLLVLVLALVILHSSGRTATHSVRTFIERKHLFDYSHRTSKQNDK